MENSQFVGTAEANVYVNKAYAKTYDLMLTAYGENYDAVVTPYTFQTTDNTTTLYAPPADFYKSLGVDLCVAGLDTTSPFNWFSIAQFNFGERNRSSIVPYLNNINISVDYRYKIYSNKIWLAPPAFVGSSYRIWYAPRLTLLVSDSDQILSSFQSGWEELIVLETAIKMMTKAQLDTTDLAGMYVLEKQRLTDVVANRDAGVPSTVVDVYGPGSGSQSNMGGGLGSGW
jgi:hypothetical protein